MKAIKHKKVLSLVLAFAMIFSIFNIVPLSASAAVNDEFTIDGLTYKVIDETNVSVTKFNNSKETVEIPNEVKNVETNYTVNAISSGAFRGCSIVEEISLPDSLISIGSSAFASCTALNTIRIYSDIKSIGAMAFSSSTNLKSIYFESNEISTDCVSLLLTRVNSLKNNITLYCYEGSSVSQYAKDNGWNYEIIPGGNMNDDSIFTWKKINDDTAVEITGYKYGYEDTVHVEIPSEINGLSVTSIGTSAFELKSYIQDIVIPESITIIKEKAFYNCNKIKKISFSGNSSLTTIESEAFAVTDNVTWDSMSEISLPASLISIGDKAFAQRKNLTGVTVYSKDVEFGNNVFEGNEKLTLKGYENSTAETYAGANSHRFSYLGIDLTELKEALDKAQAVDKNLYTDDSYSVLNKAISAAKLLIAQYEVNGEGSPSDVENRLKALNDAMDGLVLKATDATETTAPDTTEPTTDTTEPTSNPAPVYEEFILGDADGNGIVNIKDVTYIQLYLARLLNETANPIPTLSACEVDGDEDITIKDVTQIQLWLAKFNVDFKIGELVKKEINSTNPTTPSETDPTTATDPTTETEPTTATDPDSDTITFYVPNAVNWLTADGGKMWIYNDATKEFMNMQYNQDDDYFYLDMPKEWSELSIYRTPYEVEEADFDISKKWNEETQTGVILNEWAGLGSRGDYDCYYITADGKGYYTLYKDTKGDEEYMKTIYFDNSQTKWGTVYIYGWGKSGLNEVGKAMKNEGNDIWSYTFVAPYIPDYGVDAFLFVNKATSKADSSSWTGAIQTGDLAIEKGKYLFVPSGTGNKIGGSWDVYNP